jgi:protein phosphatase
MRDESTVDTGEFPAFKKLRSATVSARTDLDLGALSHPGKVRPENQDSYLVTQVVRSMQTVLTNLPPGEITDLHSEIAYAMLVADGVGGAAAGAVASRTAISALLDLAIQTPDWVMQPGEQSASRVMARMKERFERLREAFEESAIINGRLTGMGTTLTLAVSLAADLVIAHVGDSRAYLFTENQLIQLTKDQTVAQLLVDLEAIRPEEVRTHHARHVLTSAITAERKAEVELHHVRLADGDQLLLCTDGLTGMLTDGDIAAQLRKQQPAMECCQALIDSALAAGGTDNVTVALARYKIPPNDSDKR